MAPAFPLSVSLLTSIGVQIACQAFKVVLYSVRERRPAFSWFISAGGMPSAHSAFVTALSVSVGLWSGFASDVFAVSCVFSVIIIYDSWRLRGAVQHHAKALAKISRANRGLKLGPLNENIGHSIPEIAAGIVAGGALAAAVYFVIRWV
ncbi:MAG TPA: divergent PAP2 family protein [Spirochaetia bacterium]|nr:divergent PAP2 family protein [Spirochaetia bacterium]